MASQDQIRFRLQRCAGCGRVSMDRSPMEYCPDTHEQEQQVDLHVVPDDEDAITRGAEAIKRVWKRKGGEVNPSFAWEQAEAVLRAAGGRES